MLSAFYLARWKPRFYFSLGGYSVRPETSEATLTLGCYMTSFKVSSGCVVHDPAIRLRVCVAKGLFF